MRDDVTPGDGTGTPHREDHYNDIYYGHTAVMGVAGLTPDNSVEGATASQVANAIRLIRNGVVSMRKNTAVNYTVLDNDYFTTINVDTTSADTTITLPLLANNYGRRIRIMHVRGGTNKVIIAPNATDTNSLTSDGLATLELLNVGEYVEFEANDTGSALFWQAVNISILRGPWTPSIGGTATYNLQNGVWFKNRNKYTAFFDLHINTIGTGSATTISGLPANNNGVIECAGGISSWNNIAIAITMLAPIVPISTNTIKFNFASGAGATTIGFNLNLFQNNARVVGFVEFYV
jgi:hypothetical protein